MRLALSTAQWAALSPQLTYWLTCLLFETIGHLGMFRRYRVLPSEDQAPTRNRVSKAAVLRYMIANHVLTSVFLLLIADYMQPPPFASLPTFRDAAWLTGLVGDDERRRAWAAMGVRGGYLLGRQLLALFVVDTWQFWCHLAMHKVPWLYRNIHSAHHKLYLPYSYGAMYNHWAESLFMDNVSAVLGTTVADLTDREQLVFLSFIVARTVEDHSGYELPFSPGMLLCRLTGGGTTYHNVHHQPWGLKTNYEVYFTFWDTLMNTSYKGPRKLIEPQRTDKTARGSVPAVRLVDDDDDAGADITAAATASGAAVPSSGPTSSTTWRRPVVPNEVIIR